LARSTSEALAWKEDALRETFERAERAAAGQPLDDKESLSLVQELFDHTARLETRRSQKSEATA
jgi:hypothetical protein